MAAYAQTHDLGAAAILLLMLIILLGGKIIFNNAVRASLSSTAVLHSRETGHG